MNQRQFIGKAGSTALFLLASSSLFAKSKKESGGEFVFIGAEQFSDHGGWDLDQQSMDQMGSPYLLAHGLGIAVKDAETQVKFSSAGKYKIWVAPWGATGTPGKFQVLLDDKSVKEIFGTKGADWHWYDGGVVEVSQETKVSLRDLTGFEGRCEAILFCKDTSFEPNIKVFMNHRAIEVSATDSNIQSIVIQSTISARQTQISGKLFVDCTGDAKVGHLAGAHYEYNLEENLMGSTNLFSVLDASDKEQVLSCECKDKSALSVAFKEQKFEQPFPRCPWAHDLSDEPFPGRAKFSEGGKNQLQKFEKMWYWESGFQQDQIEDIELIRDNNFRAMYGAWDALKNVDGLYKNHRLGWSAFIAGKRESRRLMGDVILDGKDFMEATKFPDTAYPCSWHIDLHFSEKKYQKGFEGTEFVSDYTRGKNYKYKGIYWAAYRTLYSRNISNLFMAGRDISVSKTGLVPVRVMRTCGMMGEIVGKAAAISINMKTNPRGVYSDHLDKLITLMKNPGKES